MGRAFRISSVDIEASLTMPISTTGPPVEYYSIVRHFEQSAKAWFTVGQSLATDRHYGVVYGCALGTVAAAMLSVRTYTISGDIIKYD